MKTLDRYIIRSFFFNMVLCLAVVLALRIVMDLFINMDEFAEQFAEQKISFGELVAWVARYYGCNSLVYFTELGGVAIGMAAAFSIARMNASNELTAMMASGVSLRRVLLPIVICAMLMSVLVAIDREFALPLPSVRSILIRDRDDVEGIEGVRVRLMTDGNRSVWWSRQLLPGKKLMEMPIVLLRGDGSTLADAEALVKRGGPRDEAYYRALYKALGRISGSQATPGTLDGQDGWMFTGNEDRQASLCALRDPKAIPWYKPPTAAEIWTSLNADQLIRDSLRGADALPIVDEQYGLTIEAESLAVRPASNRRPASARLIRPKFTFKTQKGRVLGRFIAEAAAMKTQAGRVSWRLYKGKLFYASDITIEEMRLRESGRHLDYASSAELMKLVDLERVPDPDAVIFTKHLRMAEPLNILVMLLVGVPFILSRERNVKASVMMCLGMSVLFHVFVYSSRYFDLPPVWLAWLPVLVFGPIAAIMIDSIKT